MDSALRVDKGKSKVPETSLPERGETSSSSLSSEYTSNSNVSNETNSGGRILSPVWGFFRREKTTSKGHFSAKCDYCLAKWARGEPQRLEAHLVFDCPNVDNEVQQLFIHRIALRDDVEELQSENFNLKKIKYFPQTAEEDLSEERIYSINRSLLKAFIVCEHRFASCIMKECNEIIKFFTKSHQSSSYLHQAINELKIAGVGLHEQQFESIVKTAIQIWQEEKYNKYECAKQVASATFVVKEDESITKDFEIEEAECDNLEIIEQFDIENIVCLRDEIFHDGESDTDNEGSYDVDPDEFDQFNDDELVVSNKIGQGVFDFDPADLAADLMKEWSYEDDNYSLS
ncbi:29486_t:CDS:2 [Gigaspora margarita]|uniref:29486_t:CDS:1 n=1 Tax=Gigaspora margarita TaxID=4874 RepID=A0ABM8VY76_GIGMA|nr:29486_t:CDS:2 [Gigaspora margarita]